ncbi:thrombin inhibitor hemalin [Parasteatoda tepidariorum]|nr:tissue factor pathway inhibitor [Parasteatoda tepidariorum]
MASLTALLIFSTISVVFASTNFPRDSPNQDQAPPCLQKVTQGLCLAYFERFFYNATAKTCQEFVYGGCQGNQNNFPTFDACMTTCKDTKNEGEEAEAAESAAVENTCSLPKQPGICYAHFERFYFNGKKCESFIYGGCMGNKNNFETIEECKKACIKENNQVQVAASSVQSDEKQNQA